MAMERYLETSLLDSHFFDDMFDDVNREIARAHHDMRCAMRFLTPRDLLSSGDEKVSQQLEAVKNPIVTNEDGSKEFNLQFDVSNFKPDEIKVKTDGNELSVEAKHEDKSEHSRVFHHFTRHYTLPEGVDPNALGSTLSKDGVLTVKGPFNADNAIEEPPAKKQALEEPKSG